MITGGYRLRYSVRNTCGISGGKESPANMESAFSLYLPDGNATRIVELGQSDTVTLTLAYTAPTGPDHTYTRTGPSPAVREAQKAAPAYSGPRSPMVGQTGWMATVAGAVPAGISNMERFPAHGGCLQVRARSAPYAGTR